MCKLTVRLVGGDVGEQQQAQVLSQGTGQVEAAEQPLSPAFGEASSVEVEVGQGHQEPGGGVQADADPPDVALRRLADGGADGGEVVGHLGTADHCTIVLSSY